MKSGLRPGLVHSQSLTVSEALTVPFVSQAFLGFSDMPPVFATAYLVGFVETACIELLRPYLDPGEQSVGIHVDLSHSAATPIGMRVTARVELIAVEGRKLTFALSCRDEKEAIGEGTHQRHVIDAAKFRARVSAKAGKA